MCTLTYLTRLGVKLCIGLMCPLRGFFVLGFGLVSLAPHCFLQLCTPSTVCWLARCVGSWMSLGLFCLLRVTLDHHKISALTRSCQRLARLTTFLGICRSWFSRCSTVCLLTVPVPVDESPCSTEPVLVCSYDVAWMEGIEKDCVGCAVTM